MSDLHIVVCMKPVPDPDKYDQVKIDPVTKRIVRDNIQTTLNPDDKNAIELALQIREKNGGAAITLLSMAPPGSESTFREALAMGCDRAVVLSDRAFGGADTLATSYTLAKGLEKIGGADLILCGNESADGATAQVPAQLAEWLDMPCLTNVTSVEAENSISHLTVKTKSEVGYHLWKIELPCVLAVTRAVNKPRFISAMGIIKASKKPIDILTRADVDVQDDKLGLQGSPTKAGEILTPDIGRNCKSIGDDAQAVAAWIANAIESAR